MGHGASPSLYDFANGDPVNGFDPDGRCPKEQSLLAQSWDYAYRNGLFGLGGVFQRWGKALNNPSLDTNGIIVGLESFVGNGLNIAGGIITPATYGEGAKGFGTDLGNVYVNTGSVATTVEWGLTSWNMGAFVRGVVGQDALTLQNLDWSQRAMSINTGIVGTASVALPTAQWTAARIQPLVDTLTAETVTSEGAADAANLAKLKDYYRQIEKYGADGAKELENGRIRFYDTLTPASSPGEMAGARLVREWDPASGATRTWYETVDQTGTVRSVAPKPPIDPQNHLIFDAKGNYVGRR
jgi:hypothetical protein